MGTADLYPGKLQTALLGSNAPDIFELQNVTLSQVKAGLIDRWMISLAQSRAIFCLPAWLRIQRMVMFTPSR